MKTFSTLIFFFFCLSSFSQTVLTYKDVYDFYPGEVIGYDNVKYYTKNEWTNPGPPPPFGGFNVPMREINKCIDSILNKTMYANGDSIRYMIQRTSIKTLDSLFIQINSTYEISTIPAIYNYRDVPIINTLPTPPANNGKMDTSYNLLGGNLEGFKFSHKLYSLRDSSFTYFRGMGGPYIFSSLTKSTFAYQINVVKKNGFPRMVNPTIVLVSSINENMKEGKALEIWPNPAQSTLNIRNLNPDFSISIFDWTGKAVHVNETWNGSSIDIASFKPGFYTIQAKGKGQASSTLRFLKH